MDYNASQIDINSFRNGPSVHLKGWMDVKRNALSFKKPRFAVLSGEVLALYLKEGELPIDEFDVANAVISVNTCRQTRHFKITRPGHVYSCTCATIEEMQAWTKSLLYASKRSFENYYKLLVKIGRGRFSKVYSACPKKNRNRVVAVKIVKKEGQKPRLKESLRCERYVNSVLRHPNIVRALDMFSTIEKDHMVFEIMLGGNLRSLLRKHRRLPESHARTIMTQLNSALAYLHTKNVAHCDVRPANIFCSDVKLPMSIALGDFGSVRFCPENRVNQNVQTTATGVPPYVSIEICRQINYGPPTDMWSAGVVLYEMLSGDPPFPGSSIEETTEMIKKGHFTFDNQIWKAISPEAKRLIRQLLQPDPFKRLSAIAVAEHPWILRPSNPSTDSTWQHEVERPRRDEHVENSPRITRSISQVVERKKNSFRGSREGSSISCPGQVFGSNYHNIRPLLPSVKSAVKEGFGRAISSGSSRFDTLLDSPVVQMQLSFILPYRRKLVVVSRAFIAVFRMRSLLRGECVTKRLPLIDNDEAKQVSLKLDQRRACAQNSWK